jgi:hypothetical protein
MFSLPDFNYLDEHYGLSPTIPITKSDPEATELGFGGRHYQTECFHRFANKRLSLFIAPTGSGKSSVQVFNAAREIIDSGFSRKQVFVVPQLHIGDGFVKHDRLLMPNGKIYFWECIDLCDNRTDGSSVRKLKDFLSKSFKKSKGFLPSKTENKIALATERNEPLSMTVSYAAFIRAFESMTRKEKLKAFKNTSFRLDEVHHICGVSEEEVESTNKLGKICKFILKNGGSLHLTTATFFRGDQNAILDESYIDQFEIYRIQFMEHWKNLNLRQLTIKYNSYTDSKDLMKQVVAGIESERNEPPFIILPSDGHKIFKTDDKWKWTKQLVKNLEKRFGAGRVLDLVSPDTQKEHKKRLIKDDKDFDVVVTCSIGREGTDWPACSRVYNLSLDNNTVQPIQKLGRALRFYIGKTNVKMINYIEHFPDWNCDSEKTRQLLSDRFNAVLVASMLDDWFYPILMPVLVTKTDASCPTDKDEESSKITLEDLYGHKRGEVIEQLMQKVLSFPNEELTTEVISTIIDSVIENFKTSMAYEVDHAVLKERLFAEVVLRMNPSRTDLRMSGIVIDFVREKGWDKVVREHIIDHSPFSGTVKTEDLQELHNFLRSVQDPLEKYLPLCKQTNVFHLADVAFQEAQKRGEDPTKAMQETFVRLVGQECYDYMRKIRKTKENPTGILNLDFLIEKGLINQTHC